MSIRTHYWTEKVGEEWHVLSQRFVSESPFTVARCTGPVPAGDVMVALRLMNQIECNAGLLPNIISGLKNAVERFQLDLKDLRAPQEGVLPSVLSQ